MTFTLTNESSEGWGRFLISPGEWFRGRKVVAVEREWHTGVVRVEVR